MKNIKNLISGILVAAVAMAGMAVGTAGATSPTTDVTGVVTKSHVATAGASVTVLCHGNTQMDTTDSAGSYLVTFPVAQCPFGSTVKVTAVKGGQSGVATGTVTGVTTKLNLAIVNVEVPELGFVAAVVAGGAGIGLIGYMRRRQFQQ